MFTLSLTPDVLSSIVAALLAIAFDWFPVLAPWYDKLTELKKRQLMGALLALTVFAIYGGICVKLFFSVAYSCDQVGLAELVKVAVLVIATNQTMHSLAKPTLAYKLAHISQDQGSVE